MPRKPTNSYNDSLDADLQITTEEEIAARIFDDPDVDTDEECAAQLGRDILRLVLSGFRPDLMSDYESDPGRAHDSGCARHVISAAECTCTKAEQADVTH